MQEQHFKLIFDIASLGNAIVTLIGLLPPIAAALSIVWTIVQLREWWKNKKKGK